MFQQIYLYKVLFIIKMSFKDALEDAFSFTTCTFTDLILVLVVEKKM